ncbi:MAG: phosphate-starvation-inducible PsiE family protein [Actinomycetota bacterium]
MDEQKDNRIRERTEGAFGYVEDIFYVAVAVALAIAGVMLFGYVVYDFAVRLFDGGKLTDLILEFLDGLLLVFIITELIHTVRAVIDEKVLVAEPFLIVGIVAAIRRLIVISAEAKDLLGTPEFADAMFEIGLLTGSVLLLAAAIFLLRSTVRSEPSSAHEPDADG